MLHATVKNGCHGIAIEVYGLGGTTSIRRDTVAVVGELIRNGIPIITSSQYLYKRSDLTKYEAERLALLKGVISARDMTSESATTKLIWGLGQGTDAKETASFFNVDIAGEVTLD